MQNIKLRKGFSLLELVVAIGVFSVIVSIAMGGLANVLRTQRQVAKLIEANVNMSFILEQMAREIRTGRFFCDGENTFCSSPNELQFVNAEGNAVTYRFFGGAIQRQEVKGGVPSGFQAITSSNIVVNYLRFALAGHLPNDGSPPRISIVLGIGPKGEVGFEAGYGIQTTISARVIDG